VKAWVMIIKYLEMICMVNKIIIITIMLMKIMYKEDINCQIRIIILFKLKINLVINSKNNTFNNRDNNFQINNRNNNFQIRFKILECNNNK